LTDARTGRDAPRTPHSGFQTTDHGPRTSDSGFQTTDHGPRTPHSGVQTTDHGPRTPHSGFQTTDHGPRTPHSIPILDLRRQYDTIRSEIDEAIHSVLESGEFILGPHVKQFEDEAAAYCGAKHAIGLASGTDALLLALRALGIGPGDAVLVPSFTFFATAGVVHNVGATPIFCDIDPRTFNLDPESARAILAAYQDSRTTDSGPRTTQSVSQTMDHGPRTADLSFKAIIPVHLYGQMADMDEIMALAREFDLAVIEDAAQAIGAQYVGRYGRDHGPRTADFELNEPASRTTDTGPRTMDRGPLARSAGSFGAVGCFSFYPTKNLGAYGDAGMVTTNDNVLAEKTRLLRVHGAKPKYVHHVVGINSRLDALQAVVLSVKLKHLDAWSAARRQLADRYDEHLAGVPGIVTPHRAPDRTHIFHQYTLRVTDRKRDALAAHLKNQGIGTMIYYPGPLHLQECFAHLGHHEGDFPQSERASREVLSLPMFPEMTTEEQDRVVAAVREFTTESP
jgi:dTDP-4-amino-4,6-dideoxygalactose transaminase